MHKPKGTIPKAFGGNGALVCMLEGCNGMRVSLYDNCLKQKTRFHGVYIIISQTLKGMKMEGFFLVEQTIYYYNRKLNPFC